MARNKPLVFDAVDLGKQWANSGQAVVWLWLGTRDAEVVLRSELTTFAHSSDKHEGW